MNNARQNADWVEARNNIQNLHMIEVKYHGPTNYKGSRTSLTSLRHPGNRIMVSRTFSNGGSHDDAVKWLLEHGYTIVGSGETPNGYVIAVNEFHKLSK